MIRSLLSHLVSIPSGGNAEVSLSHEGINPGLAFLIMAILGVGAVWAYRWGAPGFSRFRRGFLAGLRIILIALFVFLLVKPVLMLTLNDPVREKLIVLLDTSTSMELKDRRRAEDDEKRAAISAGLIAPADGLKAAVPGGMEKWRDASRAELLRALASNDQMKLWTRLQEKADLVFYSMGKESHQLGPLSASVDSDNHVSLAESKSFFDRVKFTETETAIGDSLHSVLDENRGQPIVGVLVVTDGANNSGIAPEEVAQIAKEDGRPLYTFGIGITMPKDIIVRELTGPRGAFVKERAEFTVKVRGSGFSGRKVKLHLKAGGRQVDEQEVALTDTETEYKLGFAPQEKGEVDIEAGIDPVDEESATDNNAVTTKIRVLDSKVKVLYVEGEPRWDFRYLLATLQRDRRLDVKCVLFNGDPDLGTEPNSPFLKQFPAERADLVGNEIIILGDVDPAVLGATRMKLINEWVSDMGGGLIFLAGPKYNPFRYAGTPLEPLLPVELATGMNENQWATRSRSPVALKLTPTGELSELLKLSDNNVENRRIWKSFPGVRWTARVSRARPTAQVFLVNSDQGLANRDDLMPVIAQQQYGQGMVMYFGFDETYRWRSTVGEKYYIRIWNQVIQSFSLERQLGASTRTQLKVDRPEYLSGDKAVISGKIYSEKLSPLEEASVPATLTIQTPDGKIEKAEVSLLSAGPDRPGEYSLEYPTKTAGLYSFSTIMDPKAVLKFEVFAPKQEQSDTAMNADMLQNLAQISGGKFLREEDLNGLPNLISSKSATVPRFVKLELYYSVWWMVALMSLAAIEWLFRRLWQLK